jgi:putative flippase GtrA
VASKQFAFFLGCGGLAAGLNWGSRFFFSIFFQFEIAVILAFFVGLLSGFILMRMFVFEGGGQSLAAQARRYMVVNIFALVETLIISIFCAHWLLPTIGVKEYVEAFAHLVGVLAPVATSYFGHKFWTFR